MINDHLLFLKDTKFQRKIESEKLVIVVHDYKKTFLSCAMLFIAIYERKVFYL